METFHAKSLKIKAELADYGLKKIIAGRKNP